MRVSDHVRCADFPCRDVGHASCAVPSAEEDAPAVRVILVSEAAPLSPDDGYDAPGNPLFARTTVEAFRDAGFEVTSIGDVRALGVHITTAVKCAKTGHQVDSATVRTCSVLLERELALFPNTTTLLLMGDVAIRAANEISRRVTGRRAIPAGPTYLVRGGTHELLGMRAFPSYLQAGPAFYIERQKRRMIAEDIAAAMAHAGLAPSTPGEPTAATPPGPEATAGPDDASTRFDRRR